MTVCDGGGVKNHQKKRDILYGRPLCKNIKKYKNMQKIFFLNAKIFKKNKICKK